MLRRVTSYSLLAVLACCFLSQPTLAEEDPNLARAGQALRKAMGANNIQAGNAAIQGLLRLNSAGAVKVIARLFPHASKLGTSWYWAIIKGLGTFTSADALTEVGKFIKRYKNAAPGRDLMFALQSNYSPYAAPMLMGLVQKAPPTIAFAALKHIGTLRQKSSVDGLLEMLSKYGKSKKPIVQQIEKALQNITGQNFGSSVEIWRRWWDANKQKPLPPSGGKSNTGTAADDMGGGRKYGYGKLTGGNKKKIIVIGATREGLNFDRINGMLNRLKIPHITVTKKDVNDGKVIFDDKVVAVFINCSNFREHCIAAGHTGGGAKNNRMRTCQGTTPHNNYSDKLSNKSVKNIRNWVNRGGYLFTEDWGLWEVLERGFGSFVKAGDKLKEQSVPIRPEVGMTSHPYLQRMFGKILQSDVPQGGGSVEPGKYQEINQVWKIDDESPSIKIVNKRQVKVLLSSEELAKKNNVDKAVGITFPVGGRDDLSGTVPESRQTGGRVLHVLSHFGKQGGHTLQNLLLNYLIQANERWLARQARQKFKKK